MEIEQEFKELLERLEGSELSGIALNFMEDEQVRQILIDNLTEGDKQDIIDSYKR
ncbi:MAG TPA: hypothetical protein VNX01_02575 [Bacteroidia bacterium]|jgi:hypothetical protein|nr:hypothetical protein [Bacteroidia bacterium]